MPNRPVELDDLTRFQLAGDAEISPDCRRIVFTVKRIDAEKNKYFTRLWMADLDSGTARPFTADCLSDGSPRWSPDGSRIAFVRTIKEKDEAGAQLFVIPADGGEAQRLTHLDEGAIEGPRWSPDGTSIAFLYRDTPPQYRKQAVEARRDNERSGPVRVHTHLFYRLDGFGYFDESYWQLAVACATSGEAYVLTEGPYHVEGFDWSPDGSRLVFASTRRDDFDLIGSYTDLWTVPVTGGDPTKIPAPDGPKESPAWSPDGRWIAWVGHLEPEESWGTVNQRVLVIPAAGAAEARDLTGHADFEVGWSTLGDMHEVGGSPLLQWSPDSRALYFPVSARGATLLYRAGLEDGAVAPLTPSDREMGSFSLSRDGSRLGVQLGSATELSDVYVGTPRPGGVLDLRRVSNVNGTLLSEVALQMPEPFDIPNGDGGSVHGWLLRPTGFDASRRYPAILYIHGGPAMQYGGQAAPFHELQWLAANGYVILFANPRGSKGYGEAHTSAIKGDWGNKDWQDLQAVADHGASLPYVDTSRMAVMGGSYGGYMTAWAVGHTDRFACAIADRLVSNRHSMSGTCDFPWRHGTYWKGNAWDDPSDLWEHSPLHYAGNVKTPVLIIHSDGDLRCPVGQAEEFFAALRLQGKPVEFVRYPAESSHGLSRSGPPDLRLDRLRRNLAWLDRWLKA